MTQILIIRQSREVKQYNMSLDVLVSCVCLKLTHTQSISSRFIRSKDERNVLRWETQEAMASQQELRHDEPAKEECQVQIIVFQFPHIRDPSVGASLFEVDKIRPRRDSCGESAFLRAAEAFDRLR